LHTVQCTGAGACLQARASSVREHKAGAREALRAVWRGLRLHGRPGHIASWLARQPARRTSEPGHAGAQRVARQPGGRRPVAAVEAALQARAWAGPTFRPGRPPQVGRSKHACPLVACLRYTCLYAWPLWANALAAVAGRPCTRARRSCRHVRRGDTVCRGRCRCAAHLAREELRTSRAGLCECWHGVLERLAGRMLAGPGAGRQ